MTDPNRGDSRRDPLRGIARGENADETNDDMLFDDPAPAVPSAPPTADPNDEVPVPIAMWPSEIDERAQVVDALRREEGIPAPESAAADEQSSTEPRMNEIEDGGRR